MLKLTEKGKQLSSTSSDENDVLLCKVIEAIPMSKETFTKRYGTSQYKMMLDKGLIKGE